MSDEPKQKRKPRKAHPWRDNIEAITVSIVVIVLFKYFVLEAYKIPTGSMQPTLMGWTPSSAVVRRLGIGGGVHDRVLVDKLSFHFRDPERWEIIVFKYPLDRSKNYIKRIAGMPGEDLEIRHGDLYAGPRGTELSILHRPRPVLLSMMRRLETQDEWRVEGGDWDLDGDDLACAAGGEVSFPRTTSGVRDDFEDGYPAGLHEAMALEGVGKNSGSNDVGDLRVEARVRLSEGCRAATFELREGDQVYSFHLPGPAGDAGDRPTLRTRAGATHSAQEAWRAPAGRWVDVAVQNVDDLLEFEVGGEVVASLEIDPVPLPTGSTVRLACTGGARFSHVRVRRDIHYTTFRQNRIRWEIPGAGDGEDSYVMLGDNTQDSSDSRDWMFARYSVPTAEGEAVVRGNFRPDRDGGGGNGGNPRTISNPWGADTIFFHDELGERWVFQAPPATPQTREECSYVPRSLIQGRAVMVVWPLSPRRGVFRVQWVH